MNLQEKYKLKKIIYLMYEKFIHLKVFNNYLNNIYNYELTRKHT